MTTDDCTLIRKCKNCESWEYGSTCWNSTSSYDRGRCSWWNPPKLEEGQIYVFDARLETREDFLCNAFHPRLLGPFSAVMGDDCGPFSYIEFKCRRFHGSVASPDRTRELVEWLNKLWAERAPTK